MPLSSRLPLSALIDLCRALRHYLGAGISLRDAFRHQANKGPTAARQAAGRIAAALTRGDSLETALEREPDVFPSLFLALTRVGEESGMLAEVFAELEKYYVRQRKLWREFLARITWPLTEFVLAILVLALLIFLMGAIAESRGTRPLDPLGIGLSGASGAAIFLAVVVGVLASLAGGYVLLRRRARGSAAVDSYLLGLPAIGPCLRALALTRFCTALRLTTETGMSIGKAVRLSLLATGNQAFMARSEPIEAELRRGRDLTTALADRRLFPEEFRHMLVVAEESGTLAEVLAHQANHYDEEASRRLAVLTGLAGYAVWGFVGAVIIIAIFRIALWYIAQLG